MEWLDHPWGDRIRTHLQLGQAILEMKVDSTTRPERQIDSFHCRQHKLQSGLSGHPMQPKLIT